MTRWKLTIEYDGTDFYGWQYQDDVPTVQAAIETAIKNFCQQDVRLHVAGRTDAGVHARGQVAHADFMPQRPMSGHDIAKAINAHLRPARISILNAEEVSENFHARFGAVNKLYHYRIINRTGFLTIDRDHAWHVKTELDVRAMQEAARLLLGQHDFSTFRDAECQAASPVKTLDRFDISAHAYDGEGGREILCALEAKSFLHHQVRNMVGTLALVGQGKWSADDLKAALEARDRTKGGPTAPATGLTLMRVDYDRTYDRANAR
jgi:tRNA pseudouridine38-40 synthase